MKRIQFQWPRNRILAPSFLVLAGFLALLFFQNFSEVPLENLKPKFYDRKPASISESAGEVDIRDAAPSREVFEEHVANSETIAQPESGKDLNSVSEDWAKRQALIMTGGVEQKILENLNKTVHRTLMSDDSQDEEELLDEDGQVIKTKNNGPSIISGVKFSAINKLEVAIANESNVTCTVDGNSLQLDVSRAISQSFDINLRHNSGSSSSSVLLNYSW